MGKIISDLKSDKTSDGNIIVMHDTGVGIPFYKGEEYLMDSSAFINYIKNIERQVRTSKEYKAYIRYLKEDLDPPLNHCMIYSNITDEMAPIEMHHGPIFTLFDYVEIIINYHIRKKDGNLFSTSRIFHYVMEEHRKNRIQVIMLSEAAHKAVHPKGKKTKALFLDYRMAHGDLVKFLELYYTGLGFNHIGKMKKYFTDYDTKVQEQNKKSKFFDEIITEWAKFVEYPLLIDNEPVKRLT